MVEETKQETAKETEQEQKQEEKAETSPIEEAKKNLEENKKVLAQITEERKRIESAMANQMLGGKGQAGIQAGKQMPETPKEYAARVMEGKLNG